jgi:protein-tyrosine phosphatase
MRHLVREAGLEQQILVDSAGTAGYHTGEGPDRRARAAGARRGIAIEGAARQFKRGDFQRFDYVLAMDGANLEDLVALATDVAARKKLHLLRSFDPKTPSGADVPDPYYGGDDGFDAVLDLCLAACRPLLERIRREHAL